MMKTNYFKRTLGGLILGLFFAGMFVMSSGTAQAQQNDDWWNRNRRDNRVEQNRDRRDDRRGRRWDRNRRDGRFSDGYPDLGGSFDLRQTALNAGFADGAKEGRKDRNNRERFDFRDESNFQKATRDYSSRLGDRGLYQRYYREAFENGYDDGYAGY
ncbi:MAG TPA: hypothetical protein VFX97_16295 [Pyrinomonadaceae bacterium]|nr:hypothetical protein [Pyrinomonadaceae bacterium]